MNYKTSYRLLALCGAAALGFVAVFIFTDSALAAAGAVAALAVGLLQANHFCRCPQCGASLMRSRRKFVRCPKCGCHLDY